MDKTTLARTIKEKSLLKGQFILRSGRQTSEYFDKYLFESDPVLLRAVCQHLKELIPSDTEILAGLVMGGIPLAVGLSLETGLPSVFVRKTAKKYGTCRLTEGGAIQGRKVCVVEDIITTGGQVLQSTLDMRSEGAEIQNVICVISRGGADSLKKLKEHGLHLKALFTMEDLLQLNKTKE